MGGAFSGIQGNANQALGATIDATKGNNSQYNADATLVSQKVLEAANGGNGGTGLPKAPSMAPDFTDSIIQAAAGFGALRARTGRGRSSFFNGGGSPDLSAWSSTPTATASQYGTK